MQAPTRSEMSILPSLGYTLPSRSTVQHSQDLTLQGGCHLEHRDLTAVPGYADGYAVSNSEVLQFSTGSITPAPLLVRYSSLAGHLSGEPRIASSLSYAAKENRASYIGSPLVNHARVYWVMQSHPSDYITNRDTILPSSYTSPLPPYAIEQSPRYPQESGGVSTSGDLDNSFAGPTMGLGPIHSLRDCTSGQVIDSDASWLRLSNPFLPSLQEPQPSGDFTVNNILPPEQTQTEMTGPPQLPPRFTTPLTNEICPPAPFPYPYPAPPQPNSTSYSTSDGYTSSYHSFPTPNQHPFSWPPQEHLGNPLPVHPQYTRPVDLPGFHEFDAISKMELRASGTLDNHKAHLFRNHATYIPGGDDTAGSGANDYGSFDERKHNSEQAAGPRQQPSLPLDQPPLSSFKLHSHGRASRIEGRSLSGPTRPTRRSATPRSRVVMTLPKARSMSDRNVPNPCGWQVDEGRKCGMPISYSNCANHFAAVHDIEDIARNVKVTCRWCSSKRQKEISRHNLLRHLREVHLCCPRSETRTIQTSCGH
ncbi:hypothetical protein F5141DRAFT_1157887 [Pisolithus sp. B1]|nr:hypothetical protein F5141DRAFT_1157887 [Pisolithus sp. B1]